MGKNDFAEIKVTSANFFFTPTVKNPKSLHVLLVMTKKSNKS